MSCGSRPYRHRNCRNSCHRTSPLPLVSLHLYNERRSGLQGDLQAEPPFAPLAYGSRVCPIRSSHACLSRRRRISQSRRSRTKVPMAVRYSGAFRLNKVIARTSAAGSSKWRSLPQSYIHWRWNAKHPRPAMNATIVSALHVASGRLRIAAPRTWLRSTAMLRCRYCTRCPVFRFIADLVAGCLERHP